MTNLPPTKRDLEYAAVTLEMESKVLKQEGHTEDSDSLARVADLCKQLVPALEQFGPLMEQFFSSRPLTS